VPPERLAVVEQSDRLAAHLRQRFPAIHVLHGDAAELPALLAQLDGPAAPVRVQHIVSGLPLLSIPTPVRQRILHAGAQVLAPGGRLLQFTYALHGPRPGSRPAWCASAASACWPTCRRRGWTCWGMRCRRDGLERKPHYLPQTHAYIMGARFSRPAAPGKPSQQSRTWRISPC
jgi:hypothetical protein